jgi:hypothetical protein
MMPVDAFYEWKKIGAGKQPYAIVGADGLPLALAGLWVRWKDRASARLGEFRFPPRDAEVYERSDFSKRGSRRVVCYGTAGAIDPFKPVRSPESWIVFFGVWSRAWPPVVRE